MKKNVSRRSLLMVATAMVVTLLVSAFAPARALASTYPYYTVKVDSGYLALRCYPSYEDWNEIGELYTGDVVRVIDSTSNSGYWKVTTSKYASAGWVNKNYLVYSGVDTYAPDYCYSVDMYRVAVNSGYLALRTQPSYDDRNEIGELYTGDTVMVLSKPDSTYWWVYAPKYGKEGYVNRNYLTSVYTTSYTDTSASYRVSVASGYLALRTYPSYEDWNEVGELYTGDTVTVLDTSNGTYWWVYSPKYGRQGYVNSNYLVR